MRAFAGSVILLLALASAHASWAREPLRLEKRVEAQRAIERVYWAHRIWPDANPAPKPPLEQVLSDSELKGAVQRALELSHALQTIWDRPVTAAQLQQEMERMASSTRDPGMLRELFEALEDDPRLIAETLVRQSLVERLARQAYAFDARLHAATRRTAEDMLVRARGLGARSLRDQGARYQEVRWLRDGPARSEEAGSDLTDAEWQDLRAAGVGKLIELADGFRFVEVLEESDVLARIAVVSWPKESFDSWWARQAPLLAPPPEEGGTHLPVEIEETPCDANRWRATRTDLPSPRSGHTAVWTGTEMIVWGGSQVPPSMNDGGRYNPATDSWSPIVAHADAPSARWGHTAVWTGTEMIVWGGGTSLFEETDTGGRYDPTTDRWTPTSTGPNTPTPRREHTAVWTGGEMLLWGGGKAFGVDTLNTGARYDPRTDSWLPLSTGANVPESRSQHVAVWTGSEMIVWGGVRIVAGYVYPTAGGRYNPGTDTWAPTSNEGTGVPPGRAGARAVWTGAEMIVWGGDHIDVRVFNSGGRYDPASNTWARTSEGENVPLPRGGHTAVWTGTEMIVWGGNAGGPYLQHGGRYDPQLNAWRPVSMGSSAPSSRAGHSAVWTGSDMIVWGGGNNHGLTNTGGRYETMEDSWTSTSPGTVPSARSRHTAVWTGSEMIVWGGPFETTGGRYFPAMDAWVPMSTGAGTPSERFWHSAVWTGIEMIVWGGKATDGPALRTGGRYNPSSDRWSATSTAPGVPSERYSHTAVWTGTEMIVWGGNNFGPLQTGARYDPAANTWTPTSSGPGVPPARAGHTAVWTGREMIVWGGGGVNVLSTGGRYDPLTDSWNATSTLGSVPAGRSAHTAVWTGTEMIVWGGGLENDSGGRYHPESDSWRTVSSANAPHGRWGHTAVWTGLEMIVWGGESGTIFNTVVWNTGGRYNPVRDEWMPTPLAFAPSPRSGHSAVWTGSEMIVWGGLKTVTTATGGAFCPVPGEDGVDPPSLPQGSEHRLKPRL